MARAYRNFLDFRLLHSYSFPILKCLSVIQVIVHFKGHIQVQTGADQQAALMLQWMQAYSSFAGEYGKSDDGLANRTGEPLRDVLLAPG